MSHIRRSHLSSPGDRGPHFTDLPAALTRDELAEAARLAASLKNQLAELDRREQQLREDLQRLSDKERNIARQQTELAQQFGTVQDLEQQRQRLAQQSTQLTQWEQSLQQGQTELSRAQEQLGREREEFEERRRQHDAQIAREEHQRRQQWDEQRREHFEQLLALREQAELELEQARGKVVEERIAFEAECARIRVQLEEDLSARQAQLADEAARLDELAAQRRRHLAELEQRREAFEAEQETWKQRCRDQAEQLRLELDRMSTEHQQQLEQERQRWEVDRIQQQQELTEQRERLEQERRAAAAEIEKRKELVMGVLAAQRDSIEQARISLEQGLAELDAARTAHREHEAKWRESCKAEAARLLAGVEQIRHERLTALDQREEELSRREVDFNKRMQLHEQHLDRLRGELKHQKAELEQERQRQRVWIEQVETSIHMRMEQLRRFRELITAREQLLEDERRQMGQTLAASVQLQQQRAADLDQLHQELTAQLDQVREWLAHSTETAGGDHAEAEILASLTARLQQHSRALSGLSTSLDAEREHWIRERREAEQVIQELVHQLEAALDELAAQNASLRANRGDTAADAPSA